jgi:hypothetical protein
MQWLHMLLSLVKYLWLSKKFNPFNPKVKTASTWWILGNGPSLKQIISEFPEEPLNQVYCAVNYFCLSADFQRIKPSAYVIGAPELTFLPEQSIPDNILESKRNLYARLAEQTQWPMVLFVPYPTLKAPAFKSLLSANPMLSACGYNATPLEGSAGFCRFAILHGWGLPRPHNVLIPAIAMALRTRIRQVYMVGAEHSWLQTLHVDNENRVMLDHQHFYDEGKQIAHMNHTTFRPRRLHEVLQKFLYSFQSYWVLSDLAEKQHAEILNLTPNSYIDAFKKQPFSHEYFRR